MTNQIVIKCLTCQAKRKFSPTVLLWPMIDVVAELALFHKMGCQDGETFTVEMGGDVART